jgi:predicted nucleic acid-binding protein
MVVDASVAGAWFLPDERNDAADRIIQALRSAAGLVPSLFWFETRNLFLTAERRGRFKAGEALLSMTQLRRLPLRDAGSISDHFVLDLAVKRGLSAYDASYLALAVQNRLPLATLDQRLAEAALGERVKLV